MNKIEKIIKIYIHGDFYTAIEIIDQTDYKNHIDVIWSLLKSLYEINGMLTTLNPKQPIHYLIMPYTKELEKMCIDSDWEYEIFEEG